jgi:hypothetical protein
MRNRYWLRGALTIAGLTALACSLAVDPDTLNEGCPTGTKLCAGVCVSNSDPETGCARATCQPCALDHANPICSPAGECIVGTCLGRYENCDGESRNGCEIDTSSDTQHCGGCRAAPCMLPNALPDCANGRCAILRCITGFSNCDTVAENGCETNTSTDPDHCGACATPCAASQRCSAGMCVAL